MVKNSFLVYEIFCLLICKIHFNAYKNIKAKPKSHQKTLLKLNFFK
ncbi:hypothetical Protein psc1_06690 [Candidatus Phytoplasma solani]